MQLSQWLQGLYDEDVSKEAAVDLEKTFDSMPMGDLLDIATEKNASIGGAVRDVGIRTAKGALLGAGLGAAAGAAFAPEGERMNYALRGGAVGGVGGGIGSGVHRAGQLGGQALGGMGGQVLGDIGGASAGLLAGANAASAVGQRMNSGRGLSKGEKPGKSTTKDFVGALKRNPNSQDLDKAFAAYSKETGKEPSTMSMAQINEYVDKTKVSHAVGRDQKVEFMSKIARQIARQHVEVGKEAANKQLAASLRKIDADRRANPVLQAKLKKTIADAKKNPHRYMLRGPA